MIGSRLESNWLWNEPETSLIWDWTMWSWKKTVPDNKWFLLRLEVMQWMLINVMNVRKHMATHENVLTWQEFPCPYENWSVPLCVTFLDLFNQKSWEDWINAKRCILTITLPRYGTGSLLFSNEQLVSSDQKTVTRSILGRNGDFWRTVATWIRWKIIPFWLQIQANAKQYQM